VFGPQASAPTACSTDGVTVGTATVSGNGSYSPSAGFSPSQAGDYWWYATYGAQTSESARQPAAGVVITETPECAVVIGHSRSPPLRVVAA
jgi:hypothetical protein